MHEEQQPIINTDVSVSLEKEMTSLKRRAFVPSWLPHVSLRTFFPRVETFRWVSGLYFLLLGMSFVLLPQGTLGVWLEPIWLVGVWMLLVGLGLLWLNVLTLPTRLALALSVGMAIPLLGVSGAYLRLGAVSAAATLGLFTLGILLSPLAPPAWIGAGSRPDALGLVLGAIVAVQGLDFLLGADAAANIPVGLGMPPLGLALVFLGSGCAVIATQLITTSPRVLRWLAHLVCGLAVLGLQAGIAAFLDPLYWVLGAATMVRGLATILLPWWSGRAARFDRTAFRPRVALALVTAALLSVVFALPMVLATIPQHAAEQALARPVAFGSTLLVMLLAGAGGWWLAGSLSAPLMALMQGVDRIAEGGRTIPLPRQGTSELVRLSQAVEQMARALDARIQEQAMLTAQLSKQNEALHLSEARTRRLLESNIIGVVVAQGTTIIEANDAFLEMIGFSREDLEQGRIDWVAMTPPEYAPLDQHALHELLERGVCTPFEKEYVRRDGSRVPILLGAATVEQELSQWVCFILDLSRQKQAEQERTRAFQKARQQIDAFLGIVSHELKTPITSIKGNLYLAARQLQRLRTQDVAGTEEGEELVTTILAFLDRAQRQLGMQTRMVNDLIDVSRIQADRLELQVELYDLVQLVQEAVEDQRILAPTRQIDLHTSLQDVPVFADAGRVGQVLTNYLTNALKYSEASQAVEVHVSLQGAMALVAVQDRGPGLSPEQQQRIWERFYRVPGIVVKSGSGVGLGLGLHICKQLIERQGGQVGVESTPGCGSTFWFTLPRVQP